MTTHTTFTDRGRVDDLASEARRLARDITRFERRVADRLDVVAAGGARSAAMWLEQLADVLDRYEGRS